MGTDGQVLSRQRIIEMYNISIDYLTYFIIQQQINEKLESFSQPDDDFVKLTTPLRPHVSILMKQNKGCKNIYVPQW